MDKTRKCMVHLIAYCRDCSWNSDDYTKGTEKVREHALKTGHRVDVETAYTQTYNSKER